MTRAVLDTSVIIEYIDKKARLHRQAEAIFNAIQKGKLKTIIPNTTLTETYYVATKIYQATKQQQPQQKALSLVKWLHHLPTTEITGLQLPVIVEAGRIKLKYNLALTDCYILAAAKHHNAKAVFKKREKEMLDKLALLEKEYPVIFLEDYK